MPEYIERGAALKEIDQSYGLYEASLRVSGIPTADVAPVRHGRWKDNKCTACGEEAFCYGERPYHLRTDFCPMCGAKMDLEG